jgi:hypothetical protein
MTYMGKLNLIVTLSFSTALFMFSHQVSATCQLPIPDGGDETYIPSKANIFGDIVKVELPYVFIKNGRTHQEETVSVSDITDVHSSYGGVSPLSVLKPNLQVWVWFKNCRKPKTGPSEVAYFQFFSSDPTDRATLDETGKVISVP